jgi:hypothetical protein
MTVDNGNSRIQYVAFAGQTDFGFNFRVFEGSDLEVYLTPVGQVPDPLQDLLTLNVDYTVNVLTQSGSITLFVPATSGDFLTLTRNVPDTQLNNWEVGGKFEADEIELVVDKLTMIVAQNSNTISDRMLTYSVTDNLDSGNTTLPKLAANQLWKANSAGDLIAGTVEESDGWSTLRSELASETMSAPGTDNVGFYDAVDGGQNLTAKLNNMAPQKDDRAIVKNATDETKQIKLDATQLTTGTTRQILMPDRDIDLGAELILPRGHFYGLLIEQDVEPTTDIKINIGECIDATNQADMILSSPIIKEIDNNWVAGNNSGGFPSGLVITAGTWYHVFLISKTDGTVDAGFDSSLDASNLLADATGYVYYRRVGSVLWFEDLITPGTYYIYNFKSFIMGNERIYFANPEYKTITIVDPGTVALLLETFSPTGIRAWAINNFRIHGGSGGTQPQLETVITCPDFPDFPINPTAGQTTLGFWSTSNGARAIYSQEKTLTNLNSQIRVKSYFSDLNSTLLISRVGFTENL